MWEARITPEQLEEFEAWLTDEVWPHLKAADGFSGGEAYRTVEGVEQPQVVVVTRWESIPTLLSASEWFDLGAERFLSRPAKAWEFVPILTT
jgi:heme-degrading monooxygenase HmoA